MKIVLKGFFDNNFGDDYMMKIIVRYLPEFEFIVQECDASLELIASEDNVSVVKEADADLPVLLVTGSGFMINSLDSLKCELIWFLKRRHIADYCMGCNIEPLDSRLKEFLIRKKLQKFKLIIFRDKASYDWMKQYKKTGIGHLPDILFSMPEEWLPERRDRGILGISVLRRDGDSPDCGYYKAMASAADHWIERTGKGVYLMAFDTGSEDDASACENIRRLMIHPESSSTVLHGAGGEILRAYSECTKVIGARFHSAVLAMRMGIDFFPVVYRSKMKRLIDDMAYPIRGCNIEDINSADIERFLGSPNPGYKINNSVIRSAGMYAQIFCEQIWRRM